MDTIDGIGLDILENLDDVLDYIIIDRLYSFFSILYDENNINIGDILLVEVCLQDEIENNSTVYVACSQSTNYKYTTSIYNNWETGKNMKKIIKIGSVGAGVILVLAMFATVVSAQTINSNGIQTNILQNIRDKIRINNLGQDCIFNAILMFILAFFLFLKGFLEGNIFY